MPTAYTIGVRARPGAGNGPPPGGAQATSLSWRGESRLEVIAGGLGNNEIAYNAGLLDFRADDDLLVTTAGGPVSLLTSGQGFPGTLSQSAPANQPTHSTADDWIAFSAAAANDAANGKRLSVGAVASRYQATANALGVFYVLFRITGAPAWNTAILRVGANSSSYNREFARGYGLWLGTSRTLFITREANTSATYQQTNPPGAIAAEEWYAAAFVLNDSRSSGVVNGASDQVARIFLKGRPGGTHPTMASSQLAALAIPNDASAQCLVGMNRWNNNASTDKAANVLRLHSIGFDAAPPITDSGIENALDKLLARV